MASTQTPQDRAEQLAANRVALTASEARHVQLLGDLADAERVRDEAQAAFIDGTGTEESATQAEARVSMLASSVRTLIVKIVEQKAAIAVLAPVVEQDNAQVSHATATEKAYAALESFDECFNRLWESELGPKFEATLEARRELEKSEVGIRLRPQYETQRGAIYKGSPFRADNPHTAKYHIVAEAFTRLYREALKQ